MIRFAAPSRAIAFAAATSAVSIAGTPAFAAPTDVSAAAQNIDDLLAFVGGSPLSAAQRASVATETATRFRSDPAGMQTFSAKLATTLANRSQAEPSDVADLRHKLRLGIALLPHGDPAREIVEKKDPTLVFERANAYLVTEETLVAWREASGWVAGVLGVPAPAPDFIASQRRFVREHFAGLNAHEKDAIVNIASTFALAKAAVEKADKAKLAADIAAERPKARDPRTFPLYSAELLDTVAVGVMHAIFMQRLVENNTVLDNGFTMQYFNHNSYQKLLDHSHAPVAMPPPIP